MFPANFKDIIYKSNINKFLKNKVNLGLTDEKIINNNINSWLDEINKLNDNIIIDEYIYYKNEFITKIDIIK